MVTSPELHASVRKSPAGACWMVVLDNGAIVDTFDRRYEAEQYAERANSRLRVWGCVS